MTKLQELLIAWREATKWQERCEQTYREQLYSDDPPGRDRGTRLVEAERVRGGARQVAFQAFRALEKYVMGDGPL